MSKLLNKPMDSLEMEEWLPGTRILVYNELAGVASLDALLGPKGRAVILYEVRPGYGHWTCVFRLRPDAVECFDSLGIIPDNELNWVPAGYRKRSGQDKPHLTRLLEGSGYQVHYNNHRLQKNVDGVATCGRHCIVRMGNSHLDIDRYAEQLRAMGNPDEVVCAFVS
jgi:hypothetical protein